MRSRCPVTSCSFSVSSHSFPCATPSRSRLGPLLPRPPLLVHSPPSPLPTAQTHTVCGLCLAACLRGTSSALAACALLGSATSGPLALAFIGLSRLPLALLGGLALAAFALLALAFSFLGSFALAACAFVCLALEGCVNACKH